MLVANARMYGVTSAVRDAWAALLVLTSRRAGIPLTLIDHAAPAPLEALWSRADLGLVFMCGYPFARDGYAVQAVAAPVPLAPWAEGKPFYRSDFVVRADSDITTLAETLGRRIGWTVDHSQSGFNAVRHHLLRYRNAARPMLFANSVGPLTTPRSVIDALLNHEIDVGPLDSYFHDLLIAHEPATAQSLRIVESTGATPMPLLVASASVDEAMVGRLRDVLLDMASDANARPMLATLRLSGFAQVARADYDILLNQAAAAEAAGYPVPA